MSKNGTDGLQEAGISAAPQKTLRSMVSDAVSKAKGQGVVQGSTLFFKNMAESIAHSNRNLKIGMAFLTATFAIVALILGFLVFQMIKKGEGTERALSKLPGEVQTVIKPLKEQNDALEQRLAKLESEYKSQLEAIRQNAAQEADRAREDISKLDAEVQALKKTTQLADQLYPAKIVDLDRRLRELEKK